MLCDPDYINQKLINYIDYRQQLSEDTRKKYTYAATYEEFVKLIDKCEDIEHLKQIRLPISTFIFDRYMPQIYQSVLYYQYSYPVLDCKK